MLRSFQKLSVADLEVIFAVVILTIQILVAPLVVCEALDRLSLARQVLKFKLLVASVTLPLNNR